MFDTSGRTIPQSTRPPSTTWLARFSTRLLSIISILVKQVLLLSLVIIAITFLAHLGMGMLTSQGGGADLVAIAVGAW